MKRECECSKEDLILLNQQITEFNEKSEKEESFIVPAKISYVIHRNEQVVANHMSKYDTQRLELIRKYVEFDEDGNAKTAEVEVDGKPQRNYVFKDEKAFLAAHVKLLQERVKLEFYVYKEDEEDLKGISGNQKILKQMWYLIDIFTNWNNQEAVSEFEKEIKSKSEKED